MRVVAAPDKFRGTATAGEIAAAVARAAADAGADCVQVPLSDGGEGMLEAFGGGNRVLTVTGPLGEPVEAPWRLQPGGVAIIESSYANGIALAGGASGNDPEAATTRGVGELIVAAIRDGARRVIVGVGGSATTDGGSGAVAAIVAAGGLRGARVTVCCDVSTPFTEAARVFGRQKGADNQQIDRLTHRLRAERDRVLAATGVDLDRIAGSGAAGGLAGGLAALGADLVPGFDTIAAARSLPSTLDGADLVVTGEGRLDPTSFTGKVVGGVIKLARERGIAALAVVGRVAPRVVVGDGVTIVDLSERFGAAAARAHTAECVREVVAERLGRSRHQ